MMLQLIFWGLVPAMTLLCVFATMRFYLRLRMDPGPTRWIWLSLMSLIGGGVGWTVHYLTLTNLSPGDELTWSVPFTLLSLLVGVTCLSTAVKVAEFADRRLYPIVFATVFAALIWAGNIGMVMTASAQGTVAFDFRFALLSLIVGIGMAYLGAAVAARAATLKRALLGAISLATLSPVQNLIHMSATTILPDPTAPMPVGFTPDTAQLIMLVFCATVVLFVGIAGLIIDRALERASSARYRVLATTDALTGLANRTGFGEALAALLARAHAEGHAVVVAAIDLDKFKPINDLYGHATGDEVLITMAERFRSLTEGATLVGRLGGDEFVAACPVPHGADPATAAEDFAKRLLELIRAPIRHADKNLGVDGSVGLSLSPAHGTDGPALINAADIALYRVKAKRDGHALYDTQMGQDNLRRAQLEVEIAEAIRRGEFVLYYQPQVNLISGAPTGYEALIRWNHPDRGLVMPGEFIPIAESSSLISDIGAWVLREACRTAATWPEPYGVAVNVAVRQLSQPDFLATVQSALTDAGLPPRRLEIELTEASVIEDEQQALSMMHKLRALGVRLAMDDYGTGYASLATLRTFPFDKLKIDRSFINGVDDDKQLAAIVKSTLFLTRALSIPVVAEGVESRRHVEFLAREGCENVQGYYYGRPMPTEAVTAQIAENAIMRQAS